MQILARTARAAGYVGPQTDIAILTLVAQRTLTVLAREPRRQALIPDMFVQQIVRRGGQGGAPATAGTARATSNPTMLAGPTGATITRAAAIGGAIRPLVHGGDFLVDTRRILL